MHLTDCSTGGFKFLLKKTISFYETKFNKNILSPAIEHKKTLSSSKLSIYVKKASSC